MYKIKTFNSIAKEGLDILQKAKFTISQDEAEPDAIVLRSYKLHDYQFEDSLKAIGRAGAGVNNIPVDSCTEKGIVVFNTPGANANAVKELVLSGLLLASRDIVGGIEYVKTLSKKGDQINQLVEKNKSRFKGKEIAGKTLGVIGLGAIGVSVANSAASLGMNVQGHDPFISVDRAWGLSSSVKKAANIKKLLATSDFISIHMPLLESTKGFINRNRLKEMKEGAVLLNFSRDGIDVEDDVIDALNDNHLSLYVTDFPSQKLIGLKNVICMPHLGASTEEAETNCAVMIGKQIREYLVHGNIINSVNFPDCDLERTGDFRLTIKNKNIPNMVGQITAVLADNNLNILEMLNKSKKELAYTIIDVNGKPSGSLLETLRSIEGVFSVRLIK